ncbi:sensor domain-containing protein [Nocardia sp. BMG111209]|uniref:sensor domain-containing protein n=1 Tax=Nocardia sp. BMG111209 TaxID=1160137 RepID=UPI0018CA190C|nr:sensor domain-containing protein [Nocardia sp. BMG111209]
MMVREVARRVPAAMVLGALLSACGSTVAGQPGPVRSATAVQHVGGLAAMLPRQEAFPAHYTVVVLSPEQARGALDDLRGVPAGAPVEPGSCAIPAIVVDAGSTAVEVGSDDEARATVTVELLRTGEPLARVRERSARCALVRVRQGPLTSTVVTAVEELTGVAADDTLALRRTVSGTAGGPGLRRSMYTRLAQIGDIRVNATTLTFGDDAADTAALDRVFAAAIDAVRHG